MFSKINNIIYYLYFLCQASISTSEVNHPSVEERIPLIDSIDRQKLEDFFHVLFLEGDFAYTLFGDKPMGLIYFLASTKSASVSYIGWQVWKKYQYLFPLSNFDLIHLDKDASFLGFLLVNKNKCRKVIEKYSSLFKSCFSFESIDDLINLLCSPNFFSYQLSNSPENFHTCVGLLFGYSEKSAILFERKIRLCQELAQYPYDLSQLNEEIRQSIYYFDKIKLTYHKDNTPINEAIKELNNLAESKSFARLAKMTNSLYPIRINGFVTFQDDPEIELLQAKNDSFKEYLLKIEYMENFLEIIMTRLTSL